MDPLPLYSFGTYVVDIIMAEIKEEASYFFFGVRERSLALLLTPSASGEGAGAGAVLFDLEVRLLGVEERPLAAFEGDLDFLDADPFILPPKDPNKKYNTRITPSPIAA